MAGAPPGLGYLAQVNQLIIKQKVEILEAVIGFETQNKYTVFNSMGQQVFKAKEDTNCINRQCCGPARPFDMKLTDNHGNEVIHLDRPLRCSTCCFPCCLQKMEVINWHWSLEVILKTVKERNIHFCWDSSRRKILKQCVTTDQLSVKRHKVKQRQRWKLPLRIFYRILQACGWMY